MKKLFINARLLDGELDKYGQMPVKENVAVEVDGEKITAIYDFVTDTSGYEVIDLQGRYLLPGLINLHVHLAASGKPPKANAKPVNYKRLFSVLTRIPFVLTFFKKMELKLAKEHLYSGVTTIRTVGGVLDLDGQVRDLIDSGKKEGPRIISCNTAISVPGGHFAGSLATESSIDSVVSDIERVALTKPDWIKLMITGGVMDASSEGEPGVLRMDPSIVKAACDKAHKLGYKVCAHVESSEGVKVALENGVDTIEHGALLDDEMIDLFKDREAAHVCTISPALPYVMLKEEVSHCGDLGRHNGKIVMDGIIECAKDCLKYGIPVGLGTDAGCAFITPYDMWRELAYFVKYAGVSPAFALHTATKINAQILGLSDTIGTIKEGMTADMIVADKDPLKSFENLRELAMVVSRGRVIMKPVINKRKDVEAALDSVL